MDSTVKMALVSSDKNHSLIQELRSNRNLIIVDSIPENELLNTVKKGEINYGLIIPNNSQEEISQGKTSELILYYKNESRAETIIMNTIKNYEIKIIKKRVNDLEQKYSYVNPISIEIIGTTNFIDSINNNLSRYLPLLPVFFGFWGLIAPCTALFSSKKKGMLDVAPKWDRLLGVSFYGMMASFFVILGMWFSIQFFGGHPAFMKGLMKNYLSWENVFYLIIMILLSHFFWSGLLGYLSHKTKNTLGAFGISFFIPVSNILNYSKDILLANTSWMNIILTLLGCMIWGTLGYFVLPSQEE